MGSKREFFAVSGKFHKKTCNASLIIFHWTNLASGFEIPLLEDDVGIETFVCYDFQNRLASTQILLDSFHEIVLYLSALEPTLVYMAIKSFYIAVKSLYVLQILIRYHHFLHKQNNILT